MGSESELAESATPTGAMGNGDDSSSVDSDEVADFLGDFGSESEDGDLGPRESVGLVRPWTAKPGPPELRAATVSATQQADAAPEISPAAEYTDAAVPCAISPLEAAVVLLDAAAFRRLLAAAPDSCSAAAQALVLHLCNGDYSAVLESTEVRTQVLGVNADNQLPVPPGDDGVAEVDLSLPVQQVCEQGNAAYRHGRIQEAVRLYSASIAQLKAYADANSQATRNRCALNRAACYLKLGYNLAAASDCSAVLDTPQPGHSAKALFRRGQAYKNLGSLAKAQSDFQRAAKLMPKDNVSYSEHAGVLTVVCLLLLVVTDFDNVLYS